MKVINVKKIKKKQKIIKDWIFYFIFNFYSHIKITKNIETIFDFISSFINSFKINFDSPTTLVCWWPVHVWKIEWLFFEYKLILKFKFWELSKFKKLFQNLPLIYMDIVFDLWNVDRKCRWDWRDRSRHFAKLSRVFDANRLVRTFRQWW